MILIQGSHFVATTLRLLSLSMAAAGGKAASLFTLLYLPVKVQIQEQLPSRSGLACPCVFSDLQGCNKMAEINATSQCYELYR